MSNDDVRVVDTLVGFDNDTNGDLVIRRTQELPDDYISALKRDKIETHSTPMGDFYKVAEIPTIWVEKWNREGFDIMKEPIREILKRLRKEELDAFITTTKRV